MTGVLICSAHYPYLTLFCENVPSQIVKSHNLQIFSLQACLMLIDYTTRSINALISSTFREGIWIFRNTSHFDLSSDQSWLTLAHPWYVQHKKFKFPGYISPWTLTRSASQFWHCSNILSFYVCFSISLTIFNCNVNYVWSNLNYLHTRLLRECFSFIAISPELTRNLYFERTLTTNQ